MGSASATSSPPSTRATLGAARSARRRTALFFRERDGEFSDHTSYLMSGGQAGRDICSRCGRVNFRSRAETERDRQKTEMKEEKKKNPSIGGRSSTPRNNMLSWARTPDVPRWVGPSHGVTEDEKQSECTSLRTRDVNRPRALRGS